MKAHMLFEDGSTCEEIESLEPRELGPRHTLHTTHRVRCNRAEDLDTCMAAQFVKQYQERMEAFQADFARDFAKNLSKPLPAYHFSVTLSKPPMPTGEEERAAIVKWLRNCFTGEGDSSEETLAANQIEDGDHLR